MARSSSQLESPNSSHSSWRHVWATGLLVLLTWIIYLQTIDFGMIAGWDDDLYLLARPEVTAWGSATWRQRLLTPELGYPVPLPTYLYYLAHQLPKGMTLPVLHGGHVCLQTCNVLLAHRLARRWIGSPSWAHVAVGIWAAHPLLVETVAWLTNLKGLLLGACTLGALELWERQLQTPTVARACAVGLLGLVALGCRPEAIVLAPVLAARTAARHPSRSWNPRIWSPLLVLVAAAAIYLPIAVLGQFEVLAAHTSSNRLDLTVMERLQRIAAALGLQVRHVIYPVDLDPIYLPQAPGRIWDVGIGGVAWIALGLATVWSLQHDSETSGGWLLWWGFYLPVSGLVVLPRFTADTYMYLPLLGWILVSTRYFHRRFEASNRSLSRPLLVGVAVLLIATLASVSWIQTGRWQSTTSLLEPLTETSPAVADAYQILGRLAQRRGDNERAREIYEEGWSLLYRTGTVPLALPKAFETTGDPDRAATLALKVLDPTYPGRPPEDMGGYLTWLIVRYQLDLPEPPDHRRIVRRQAQQSLDTYADDWGADVLARGARHFESLEMQELALSYARAALQRDPDRCELWRWLENTTSHEAPDLRAIDVSRPPSCP